MRVGTWALIGLAVSFSLAACGGGGAEEEVAQRLDRKLQRGLEDGAGTYRAEQCLGEGADRYLCVVRITQEMPEVTHLPRKTTYFRCAEKRLRSQLKRDPDAVIKINGNRCPGDQRISDILGGETQPPTTTSRALVFFSVRRDGESLTYRALSRFQMPFPVPDEIRRRLPERFRSLIPEE